VVVVDELALLDARALLAYDPAVPGNTPARRAARLALGVQAEALRRADVDA